MLVYIGVLQNGSLKHQSSAGQYIVNILFMSFDLEPLTIELTVDAKVVNTFKNGHILSSLCCLA